MLVAGQARGTRPTPTQRHDGHRVAHGPPGDVRTQLGDPTGHLVPDHRWRGDPLIHGAVQDVQVGAADAGVRDVDAYLARTWRLRRELDHLDAAVPYVAGSRQFTGHCAPSPAHTRPSGNW